MMRRSLVLAAVLALLAGSALAETRPFGRGSWREMVQAHQGRPLVVHFWSLTCAPCLAELPAWQTLRTTHPELDMVLVSTDPVAESPKLERMLGRAGLASVESWAFADGFVERLRFEIDRNWQGELPMTVQVGRDGTTESVVGGLDPDVLARWFQSQRKDRP
jgi:hypothetical protein